MIEIFISLTRNKKVQSSFRTKSLKHKKYKRQI